MNLIMQFLMYLYSKYIVNSIFGIWKLMDIIEILDSDYRKDIYLGVTGFLTAIVIFVAEVVSNKDKSKLDKKVLMSKTNILPNIIFMVINMILIWVGPIFKGNYYYLFQIFINCCIAISILQTLNMFKIIIKLTLEDNHFAIEKDKYINKKFALYNSKKTNLKNKNEKFREEIKTKYQNNKLIKFNNYSYDSKEYKAVPINYDGVIVDINLNKIEEIVNQIDEKRRFAERMCSDIVNLNTNNEWITIQLPYKKEELKEKIKNENSVIVYFFISTGEEVGKDKILFYIKNEFTEYSDALLSTIKIDKDEKYLKEDVENIINEKIELIKNNHHYTYILNDIVSFHQKNMEKNWLYVGEIFNNKIEQLAKEYIVLKENDKVNNLHNIVEYLVISSARNDNFKFLSYYIDILFMIVEYKLDLENADRKEIAFNFTGIVNSCIHVVWEVKQKIKYYEFLLSRVLKLIKKLLRKNCIEEIIIILKTLAIVKQDILEITRNTPEDEKYILQFVIGVIYAMIYESNNITNDETVNLKELIEELSDKFNIDYDYSMIEILFKFKEVEDEPTEIHDIYNCFPYGEEEDHKYKSGWYGKHISIKYALLGLMGMYPGDFWGKIDDTKITKEDLYWCNDVERILENNEYEKLLNIFPEYIENKEDMKKLIKDVKNIAKEKEIEYNIISPIPENKISEFKNKIFEEIIKEENIIELFPDKLQYTNEKIDKPMSIEHDFIPREFLFENTGAHKMLAKNVAERIRFAKLNASIRYLTRNAKRINNIEEILNNFKDLNKVIILASFKDYRTIFQRRNTYNFNGYEIPVKKLQVKDSIIFDKNSFPILKFGTFEKSDIQNGEIRENTFIEVLDFAKDEQLVTEHLEYIYDSEVYEQSEEEKRKYLRQHCLLKVRHAFKLEDSEEKNIYLLDRENAKN